MNHLVCINDNWKWDHDGGPMPKKGEIVKMLYPGVREHFIVLGHPYQFSFTGYEQCFHEDCFREVDSSFGQYCEDTYLALAQIEEAIKEGAI